MTKPFNDYDPKPNGHIALSTNVLARTETGVRLLGTIIEPEEDPTGRIMVDTSMVLARTLSEDGRGTFLQSYRMDMYDPRLADDFPIAGADAGNYFSYVWYLPYNEEFARASHLKLVVAIERALEAGLYEKPFDQKRIRNIIEDHVYNTNERFNDTFIKKFSRHLDAFGFFYDEHGEMAALPGSIARLTDLFEEIKVTYNAQF